MKKTVHKAFAAVLSAAMLINVFTFSSTAKTKTGKAIKTAEELMDMESDGDYYLARDIDLSGEKWLPIREFSGKFDGNGHEISGLTSETYGLFVTVDDSAEIKNVKLTDVFIASKFRTVGAVVSIISAGAENVTVENCYVSGAVASCLKKNGKKSNGSTAGAIVGKNNSKNAVISGCYSDAVVCSERQAGGIVGVNKGKVEYCGFGGVIENSKNVEDFVLTEDGFMDDVYTYMYCSGGICGFNYGSIENCLSNYNSMSCSQYNGGIVGVAQNNSKVADCVNLTKVWSDDNYSAGMIAGFAAAKAHIDGCLSIEPTDETTQKFVGKTKNKYAGDSLSDDEIGNEDSYKDFNGWEISGGIPVPSRIASYISEEPLRTIKGGKVA